MFLFLFSVDGHLVTEHQYCVVVQQHRNYAFAVTKQNCFLDQNGYYIPPFPFIPFFLLLAESVYSHRLHSSPHKYLC